MSTPTTIHYFPRIPNEIKCMIWEMVAETFAFNYTITKDGFDQYLLEDLQSEDQVDKKDSRRLRKHDEERQETTTSEKQTYVTGSLQKAATVFRHSRPVLIHVRGSNEVDRGTRRLRIRHIQMTSLLDDFPPNWEHDILTLEKHVLMSHQLLTHGTELHGPIRRARTFRVAGMKATDFTARLTLARIRYVLAYCWYHAPSYPVPHVRLALVAPEEPAKAGGQAPETETRRQELLDELNSSFHEHVRSIKLPSDQFVEVPRCTLEWLDA